MHIGDNQEETRRYGPLAQSVELCTYEDKVMQGSRVRFSEGPRFIALYLKARPQCAGYLNVSEEDSGIGPLAQW